MITKIYSDLKSFKTLHFKPGLNILVADKHEKSGVRDTRNGTGKTSVIELLHFLVGKGTDKKSDFHKTQLLGQTFGAIFKGQNGSFGISRKSGDKDQVFFNGKEIDTQQLRSKLSSEWFRLTSKISGQRNSPGFGSLFAYFVRKARSGAFQDATMNSSKQQSWDSQVNLAYLLGFDWTLIQKLQSLKEEKKRADNLSKLVKEGNFSSGPLNLNKMQTDLDILERDAERKRKEISSCKVLEGYQSYEDSADDLTQKIKRLNEENLSDLDLQHEISCALKEVIEINPSNLEMLYKQVGIYFTDQIKKRFEDVVTFHKQLSQNRKEQLSGQKRNAEQRVRQRRQEIDILQSKLKEKLNLLRSGIALDRMTRLHAELIDCVRKIADLSIQIPRLRDTDKNKKALQRKISEQVELIGQDVQAREDARKFATTTFASISEYLYDKPGKLVLGRTPKYGGFSVEIDISAKKSGGKNLMQVFCFDWLLVETSKKQGKFPGFLVHDSHIFDGVDGRQIGCALSFAQQECTRLGVQYIVMMNSDDLNKIKTEELESNEQIFDPTKYIMSTRLSDDETGGLFGIRF